MKSAIALLTLVLSLKGFALTTGTPAPDFKLKGIAAKGKEVSLSELKGKTIVLEWLNHGCPFVRKHYDSGNMQALQKKSVEGNVLWFSIVSSAPGKQGHVDETGALKEKMDNKSSATDILLDPSGKVGQLYGAKTTPAMYIIDKTGVLVYQGAIDDRPDTEKLSIASAKNYVSAALDELSSGKKVTTHTTKSYGCAVKYQ
ncbi:MAG TPA: redoxin domain-containing protein [Bacteriovoracaceae bacterium]|nr:redoxin domain-containing protein [Bacteriovoracaceae bacterium]